MTGLIERLTKSLPVVNEDHDESFSSSRVDRALLDIFSAHHEYDSCPPYWSRSRDNYLRKCIQTNSWIASAHWNVLTKLRAIPFTIVARDQSNTSHLQLAETYNGLFQMSWHRVSQQFLNDVMGLDNGGWLEVLDDPRFAAASVKQPRIGFGGVRYLDSMRVTRRQNTEFPITYQHIDNRDYQLHRTRVINLTQMPSGDPKMLGVGLSSISRALDFIHALDNTRNIYEEYIGRRPLSRILAVFGSTAKDLNAILNKAEERENNSAYKWLSKTVRVGFRDPRVRLEEIMLKRLPDGFNKKEEIDLAMYGIASAYGVDAREIWPVMSAGATKADTEIVHAKTQGKTPTWLLQSMVAEMARILPPSLKLESNFRDERQDKIRADVLSTLIRNITAGLNTEMLDGRSGRLMLREHDFLTSEEFNRLELESGRLPDGQPIISLFYSNAVYMKKLLTIPSLPEPLNVVDNDPTAALEAIARHKLTLMAELYQAQAGARQSSARRALYALDNLEAIYQDIIAREQLEAENALNRQIALHQTELDLQILGNGDDLGQRTLPRQIELNAGSFTSQSQEAVANRNAGDQ